MAAFVREDPQSGAEEPGVEPVDGPGEEHGPGGQALLREQDEPSREPDEREVLEERVEGVRVPARERGRGGGGKRAREHEEVERRRERARRGLPALRSGAGGRAGEIAATHECLKQSAGMAALIERSVISVESLGSVSAITSVSRASLRVSSRSQMPVARLWSKVWPTSQPASMISLVGLNWKPTPNSDAA